MFITQLGTILERYSDTVVERVTSPLTGIQRRCKFPPSIAEIVEACDAEHRSHTYGEKYDQRTAKQLRERAETEAGEKDPEWLEHRRKVAARILADYHAGLIPEGPLDEMLKTKPTKRTIPQEQTWKQFTAAELLARYPANRAPAAQ